MPDAGLLDPRCRRSRLRRVENAWAVRLVLCRRVFSQAPAAIGDPGRTRTCDQQLRRLLLYPAELRGRGYFGQSAAAVRTNSTVTRMKRSVIRGQLSRIRARVCARPREARRCRACRGHRALRHRLVRWEIAAITPAGSRKKRRAPPRPEPGPRIRRVHWPRSRREQRPDFRKDTPADQLIGLN